MDRSRRVAEDLALTLPKSESKLGLGEAVIRLQCPVSFQI